MCRDHVSPRVSDVGWLVDDGIYLFNSSFRCGRRSNTYADCFDCVITAISTFLIHVMINKYHNLFANGTFRHTQTVTVHIYILWDVKKRLRKKTLNEKLILKYKYITWQFCMVVFAESRRAGDRKNSSPVIHSGTSLQLRRVNIAMKLRSHTRTHTHTRSSKDIHITTTPSTTSQLTRHLVSFAEPQSVRLWRRNIGLSVNSWRGGCQTFDERHKRRRCDWLNDEIYTSSAATSQV